MFKKAVRDTDGTEVNINVTECNTEISGQVNKNQSQQDKIKQL